MHRWDFHSSILGRSRCQMDFRLQKLSLGVQTLMGTASREHRRHFRQLLPPSYHRQELLRHQLSQKIDQMVGFQLILQLILQLTGGRLTGNLPGSRLTGVRSDCQNQAVHR